MSRFEELVSTVAEYQKRAAENYDRIRRLAEELKDGYCAFMGPSKGACVHLVQPAGPFKPITNLDTAFSVPPRGFRPLGAIAFGLAVRVSEGTDWIRVAMTCHKLGEKFTVHIEGGPSYTFQLPLSGSHPEEFYELLFQHIKAQFTEAIDRYDRGTDARSIGFDFSEAQEPSPTN
ncbi:MAG: hypothetical protein CMK06_01980 [Ponticaulis sp.]|nr:hypothetical protein [Ponticaulis sp.]|tara:strand:- start:32863 stop:33387 length:525 start_codon:yes stop_codon:yes gene_type:complete